ncbi:ABC transporter substrate-binding protein [Alkalihalobacillus sp. LMS39]|uniref:ABC transporter substrate-binding protein n=1 Tax=Alkalihalobacillus sp. LMS39 TaxID=2924032 RepID=UPI001FB44008|nr:ABC transporter substrate-binding protein [Alkalihalobacillus sp. LMS39]UOE94838.1 ABC transporter substrate-binding protein [Alkalihalobacillus sp. LMS39]
MKKNSGLFYFVMLLICLVIFVSGCSASNETAKQESEKNTLTMAYTWNPSGVDVHRGDSWHVMRSGAAETLIGLNEDLEAIPWLAKSWHEKDETTWVIELQEGVTFHNGNEMDAESVKASLLRSLELNQRAVDLLDVQAIDVLSDYEIEIKTNQPNGALIAHLADPTTTILDVSTVEEESYPSLTGPFKIKEFTKDESLVVERYEDYWGENAVLAEVTMKFITDGNARLMALQSGDVDVATDLPLDSVELLERDDKLDVLTAPSVRTHLVLYNMNSPLFEDLKLRQVVDQSIPREEIIETVMKGIGNVANGPFADVLSFGLSERNGPNDSIEELMGKAGWEKNSDEMWEKDGDIFEFTFLTFPQRPELSVMAEIIQAELAKEGITAHIRQVENIDDTLANEQWDVAMYSMLTAHTGDPQYFLNIFYQSESPSNVSFYKSKELDEMIQTLNQTTEENAREQLAISIQEKINGDLPQSFVVHPMTVFGAKQNVTGFIPHPIEYYYIHANIDWE